VESQKPNANIQKPNPERPYLKLEMRLADSIRPVSLKIGDYYTHKDGYPREKSNQIQNVDGEDQAIIRNDGRPRYHRISGMLRIRLAHVANL